MNEKILRLEEKVKINKQKKIDYQEKIKKIDEENQKLENQIIQLKATEVLNLLEVNHIEVTDLKMILDKHRKNNEHNENINQNTNSNISQYYNERSLNEIEKN